MVESSHAEGSQPKIFFNVVIAMRVVLGKVVQEFYAHVHSIDSPFISMRGKSISFDEEQINTHFGLGKVEDDHSEFFDNITLVKLSRVLNDLYVEGTQWTIPSHDCYTIKRAMLKLVEKVWYHSLRSKLMPSTHNTMVSKERMLLLHSIIQG
ncbi:hypothetical protein PVK06_012000 [Gossypium arboreum]|uniref:Putative plant transposon protein domain-containing protein n=1 Tax=Gossypium arboreum TaxID=29729 RepID=A0ABR0QA70_GOSAR|nr:hypothetical protein PVK06_012000 [Gossypium arboreum]